jgi:hypothetical protein
MNVRVALPSFALLMGNYPLGTPEQVKNLIGGGLNDESIRDTCAARMSRALNYSGYPLHMHDPGLYVVRGKDHKWYALRMQELKAWIANKFGAPGLISAVHGGHTASRDVFTGKPGIIAFDIIFGLNRDPRTAAPLQTRALGHLDLWDGKTFTHETETNQDYFAIASKVVLWIAPA